VRARLYAPAKLPPPLLAHIKKGKIIRRSECVIIAERRERERDQQIHTAQQSGKSAVIVIKLTQPGMKLNKLEENDGD